MTAEEFNQKYPVGILVTYKEDNGSLIVTRTRSEAWTLPSGYDVVMIEGKTGGYLLSRITPMPKEKQIEE